MARGSFWDELGRDRERRRRAEAARLRAEAQIRKDERRAATGSRRDQAAQERADREAEAAALQADLETRVGELTGVLRAVVAFPVPTIEELRAFPPEIEPEPLDDAPPRWSDFAPPEPGVLGRFRHKRAEADARARFEAAYAEFTRRRDEAADRHRTLVQEARHEHEHRIDGLVAAAHGGDQDAVPELAAALLAVVNPLRDLVRGGDGVYRPDARELAVDVELPDHGVVPAEKRWRHVVSRRAVEPERRRDAPAFYRDVVGQLVLGVMASCFRAFPAGIVDTVVVNGFVTDTDPATGRGVRPCVVTVNAARSTFDELQLDNPRLEAQRCLQKLGAVVSPNPYALEPVPPLVDVPVYRRYRLTTPEELAGLDHRTDLLQMHPRDFEALVVELFAKMGYRTWPTRYAHDDGIDGVAVSDNPHMPVECLIQVKRTRNCVPPTMVQALMGALAENPRATQGYFVTTSWFSAETRRRAREHRITTMEGPELRHHIAEYLGRDVLISVPPPARRR